MNRRVSSTMKRQAKKKARKKNMKKPINYSKRKKTKDTIRLYIDLL